MALMPWQRVWQAIFLLCTDGGGSTAPGRTPRLGSVYSPTWYTHTSSPRGPISLPFLSFFLSNSVPVPLHEK